MNTDLSLKQVSAAFEAADYAHTLVRLYRHDPAELREFIDEELDADEKDDTIVLLASILSGLLKVVNP